MLKRVGRYYHYLHDYYKFRNYVKIGRRRFTVSWSDRYPCLKDRTMATDFDRHYIYHTAWAARILSMVKPEVHFDISSSLYFASLVSAFIPIKYYDYRPPDIQLDNLNCSYADLHALPFPDESIHSLSCMHVIEHIGLGRYGDRLDADGDLKAIAELKRVLAPNGSLMIVVPIGKPRIMFNAHRIYSYQQIMKYFDDLSLTEFALIPDSIRDGGLIRNAHKNLADVQSYGCGCYWFHKG